MTIQPRSAPNPWRLIRFVLPVLSWLISALPLVTTAAEDVPHPLSQQAQDEIKKTQTDRIEKLSQQIAENPKSEDLYSQRGDACFFLGQFDKAVADYDEMVKLNPASEASHWRRGIACFYADKFKNAAAQFEMYHSFDDVDRENGIWRYLSQYMAQGRDPARQGLLKYKKDDREPFPAVYQLFAGKITPEEILKQIGEAEIDDQERQKRLFYAELYIGLNYAVEQNPEKALPHLRAATANSWPRKAGFGPHYMWQVGRLHYERLIQKQKKPS
ncbi:MAG: nlpI 2 [Planctomycetaceae bacterium]|nr:nlpI 2 [Planctomycetaceae bacterium]